MEIDTFNQKKQELNLKTIHFSISVLRLNQTSLIKTFIFFFFITEDAIELFKEVKKMHSASFSVPVLTSMFDAFGFLSVYGKLELPDTRALKKNATKLIQMKGYEIHRRM